jgi:hypothetical protein
VDREPAPLTASQKDGTADMIPCTLDSLLTQGVDWSFADELPPRDPNDDDDEDEEEEDDEEEEQPPVVREPDEESALRLAVSIGAARW